MKNILIAFVFPFLCQISYAENYEDTHEDSIWHIKADCKIIGIRTMNNGNDTIHLITIQIVGYDSLETSALQFAYGENYCHIGQKIVIISDCIKESRSCEKIKPGKIYKMNIFLLCKYWYAPGPPIKEWIINGIHIRPRKLLYGQPQISPNLCGLCYDSLYSEYPAHTMKVQLVTRD